MKYLFLIPLGIATAIAPGRAQNSVSATYTIADIPTSYDTYDGSCNGTGTTLTLTLPAGENYEVTNVHIAYSMTSLGTAWRSNQRSKIRFANSGAEESEVAGVGNEPGLFAYDRDFSLANGTYPGGAELVFEMHARRTHEGDPGCNTTVVRVNAATWSVTVYYGNEIPNPKVGVNVTNPVTTLDVGGKLKISDDTTAPQAGMLRWNDSAQDFEGYNGTEWVSLTKPIVWGSTAFHQSSSSVASDSTSGDKLGSAVAIDGDRALAGAPFHDVGGTPGQGQIYVFERNGTVWGEQAAIAASDGVASDHLGNFIALSGDYLIAGVPKPYGNEGKAYIFEWNGTNWVQEPVLMASDGVISNAYGESVSIDGEYAIVGAPGYEDVFSLEAPQGKAYILKRNAGGWVEQDILTASDGGLTDHFGGYCAISGDYCLISGLGKIYVFKRNGSDWQEESIITGEWFSISSLAMSGDFGVVGSIFDEGQQGQAYVLARNGTSWDTQVIAPSDGMSTDHFGRGGINGNYIVIGAPSHNTNGNNDQGQAYIYRLDGTDWKERATLFATDGMAMDLMGLSAAISGDFAIVGAPGFGADAGQVYFFTLQ